MKFFDDPALAARFRDWVRSMIHEEVDRIRPEKRYGKVISVNGDDRVAMILFNGDDSPVPVRFTDGVGNIIPNTYVRVGGTLGDKYVEGVWGGGDGLWRSFESRLADDWHVGDGHVHVRYCLTGMTCTVHWQVYFVDGDTPLSTGTPGSELKVLMPFARESGQFNAVGVAFASGYVHGTTPLISRMTSPALEQYIQLHGTGASTGVKPGEPINIITGAMFSGTVVYQVSAFAVQLYLYVNGALPGTLL